VIPVRLADGIDAFAVVSKWLPGEGAMLEGIYLDEATADKAGLKEAHRESDHYEHWRRHVDRLSRDVPVTPLWQWDAEIDAWVCSTVEFTAADAKAVMWLQPLEKEYLCNDCGVDVVAIGDWYLARREIWRGLGLGEDDS
jgi:hypothetical protein